MMNEYKVRYGSVTLPTGELDKKTRLPIRTTYSSGQEFELEPDAAKRFGRQIEKMRSVDQEATTGQVTA